MKVRPPAIGVSEVARRGLGMLIAESTGSDAEVASHEQVAEHLGEVIARTVERWQTTGKEAIRRAELEAAERAFEEARAPLEAVEKASGEDPEA